MICFSTVCCTSDVCNRLLNNSEDLMPSHIYIGYDDRFADIVRTQADTSDVRPWLSSSLSPPRAVLMWRSCRRLPRFYREAGGRSHGRSHFTGACMLTDGLASGRSLDLCPDGDRLVGEGTPDFATCRQKKMPASTSYLKHYIGELRSQCDSVR